VLVDVEHFDRDHVPPVPEWSYDGEVEALFPARDRIGWIPQRPGTVADQLRLGSTEDEEEPASDDKRHDCGDANDYDEQPRLLIHTYETAPARIDLAWIMQVILRIANPVCFHPHPFAPRCRNPSSVELTS